MIQASNNNMQNMHHGMLLQGPQLNYSHSWSRACNFGLLPNFFNGYRVCLDRTYFAETEN